MCESVEADRLYEVVVVGAGVQGSSTAYYLAKKLGVNNVLLLEQFGALNARNSSNGSTRLTKRAYTTTLYVAMVNEAFKMWRSLEDESKTQLHIKTGCLVFGPPSVPVIGDTEESVRSHGIPHKIFSGKEANERYSKQLSLPEHFSCILDEDGGLLLAAKAVKAFQQIFVEAGGELLDEHPVTEIIPGDIITVKTSRGSFKTKRLVLTVGPWAPKLLASLGLDPPLKVVRVESLYWKVDEPEDFSSKNFPVFIGYGNESNSHFYGTPVHEYPGLFKVCFHEGVVVDPDDRDGGKALNTLKETSGFVSEFFKGVASTPSILEPCLLTKIPDYNPILDYHPDHPNIVIGAGFSGHGFKLGPVIGKILSELCLRSALSYDLSIFKISRNFSQT